MASALHNFTTKQLMIELINRTDVQQAPTEVKRMVEYVEAVLPIGNNNVAMLTMDLDSYKVLMNDK